MVNRIISIRHGLTAEHPGAVTILTGLDDQDRAFYIVLTCSQMWKLLKGFTPVGRMLERLGMPDQTTEPPESVAAVPSGGEES